MLYIDYEKDITDTFIAYIQSFILTNQEFSFYRDGQRPFKGHQLFQIQFI